MERLYYAEVVGCLNFLSVGSWWQRAVNSMSFDEYLAHLADRLKRWKLEGVVGVKTIRAYTQGLAVGDPTTADARRIYESNPLRADERARGILQDLLFRHVLRQCDRLDLPVQIHAGFGWWKLDSLHLEKARATLLVPLFEHPDFRNVRFMVFHGSWPYTAEMAYLASIYENVYLDFNCMAPLSGEMLERALSEWLDIVPLHKLMTGTDGSILEICGAVASETRRVLAKVLAKKIEEDLYTEELALEAAHAILHRNAEEAYQLSVPSQPTAESSPRDS